MSDHFMGWRSYRPVNAHVYVYFVTMKSEKGRDRERVNWVVFAAAKQIL